MFPIVYIQSINLFQCLLIFYQPLFCVLSLFLFYYYYYGLSVTDYIAILALLHLTSFLLSPMLR